VNALINRLLDSYDGGRISRRRLVRALAPLLAAAPAAAADTLTVKSLNHVTLFVSDVERSRQFYQDLFAAPVVSKQANGINLAAGPSSFIGLYKGGQGPPSINHFCLGIDGSVETASAALEKHGIKPTIRDRDGVKELYFRDPDNLQVQLQNVDYRG
jgi:catechol 2,3-dioxygenase-like lactoylglutathione lyase family enzyme